MAYSVAKFAFKAAVLGELIKGIKEPFYARTWL
jgi:hypothetical protein